MLAAAFPWDVAIAAVSTLVAGLGATWWAGRLARIGQTTHWRLEEQRAAAEQVLRAWSNLYIALARAARDGRENVDEQGLWAGPHVDFTEWTAAIERLSLVADHVLVQRAVELDTQIWRHHVQIGRLGYLVNTEWRQRTQALHDARMRFVRAARAILGSVGDIHTTSGKPPPDDPIWTDAYWQAERQRTKGLADADPPATAPTTTHQQPATSTQRSDVQSD